jgi:Ribonuclease HepT-like
MVRDAVVRNLEVIGEAAKRIDDSYHTVHREIPWRTLGGLRDVLIHQYEGVDPESLGHHRTGPAGTQAGHRRAASSPRLVSVAKRLEKGVNSG